MATNGWACLRIMEPGGAAFRNLHAAAVADVPQAPGIQGVVHRMVKKIDIQFDGHL